MITQVLLGPQAQKALKKVPRHVAAKLAAWIGTVKLRGLEETKKIPGYHDEPLKGQRSGQRSIRLNRAYRAIYVLGKNGAVEFVRVEEVHKHDY